MTYTIYDISKSTSSDFYLYSSAFFLILTVLFFTYINVSKRMVLHRRIVNLVFVLFIFAQILMQVTERYKLSERIGSLEKGNYVTFSGKLVSGSISQAKVLYNSYGGLAEIETIKTTEGSLLRIYPHVWNGGVGCMRRYVTPYLKDYHSDAFIEVNFIYKADDRLKYPYICVLKVTVNQKENHKK